MSKEEAVQLLTAAGYKAKVENSVVIARVENFTKKEFEKVRKILKDAGYNSSFGIKESKGEEKNVRDEESAEILSRRHDKMSGRGRRDQDVRRTSESWDLYRFSLLQRRKTGLVAGSGERL